MSRLLVENIATSTTIAIKDITIVDLGLPYTPALIGLAGKGVWTTLKKSIELRE
jgi:hypothetical protein